MNNRKHTFDKFRKNQNESTLNEIRFALKILQNAEFKNITTLSKAVAKIINEIRSNQTDNKTSTSDISDVTLRRNNDYRYLLNIKLFNNATSSTEESISDYKLLESHCANIEKQNESLINKIQHLDSIYSNKNNFEISNSNNENYDAYYKDIEILLYMINKIMKEVHDIFVTETDGLHSPMGDLIIETIYLNRFKELNNEIKSR